MIASENLKKTAVIASENLKKTACTASENLKKTAAMTSENLKEIARIASENLKKTAVIASENLKEIAKGYSFQTVKDTYAILEQIKKTSTNKNLQSQNKKNIILITTTFILITGIGVFYLNDQTNPNQYPPTSPLSASPWQKAKSMWGQAQKFPLL